MVGGLQNNIVTLCQEADISKLLTNDLVSGDVLLVFLARNVRLKNSDARHSDLTD